MKKFIYIFFLLIIMVLYCDLSCYNNHTITYKAYDKYLKGSIELPEEYKLDTQKYIIYDIEPKTTVGDFLSKVSSDGTLLVLDNGNVVDNNELVKTGYVLRVEYTGVGYKNIALSVEGDVLSEGNLTINGAKKTARHILTENEFTKDEFLLAADYNDDGVIKINDVTKMVKEINKPASVKITANFVVLDSNKATSSATTASCYLENGSEGCIITAPTLTGKDGYEAAGWNTDKDATDAKILSGGKGIIKDKETYYAIVGQKITVTFDKNSTFDKNTVNVGVNGYDYKKTNIEADSLEYTQISCADVDGTGCYINDLPIIYSKGNETHGFTLKYDEVNDFGFDKILEHKFTEDTTVYARVYNDLHQTYFTVGETFKVGNVTFEVEKGTDATDYSQYSQYLEYIYNKIPELFLMKGKVYIVSSTTFGKMLPNTPTGAAGFTRSLYAHPQVIINNFGNEVTFYTLVHELSHALDNVYGAYTRNYDTNKISDQDDVKQLYQKYFALPLANRPMGEYAYTILPEFWAEANASRFGKKFNDIGYYYMKKGLIDEGNSFNDTNDEIDLLVEKYLCIISNNFNEGAKCS